MICRLPVDLLPSGLWYPFANESDTPQNGGHCCEEKSYRACFILDRSGSMGGLEQDTIGAEWKEQIEVDFQKRHHG